MLSKIRHGLFTLTGISNHISQHLQVFLYYSFTLNFQTVLRALADKSKCTTVFPYCQCKHTCAHKMVSVSAEVWDLRQPRWLLQELAYHVWIISIRPAWKGNFKLMFPKTKWLRYLECGLESFSLLVITGEIDSEILSWHFTTNGSFHSVRTEPIPPGWQHSSPWSGVSQRLRICEWGISLSPVLTSTPLNICRISSVVLFMLKWWTYQLLKVKWTEMWGCHHLKKYIPKFGTHKIKVWLLGNSLKIAVKYNSIFLITSTLSLVIYWFSVLKDGGQGKDYRPQ